MARPQPIIVPGPSGMGGTQTETNVAIDPTAIVNFFRLIKGQTTLEDQAKLNAVQKLQEQQALAAASGATGTVGPTNEAASVLPMFQALSMQGESGQKATTDVLKSFIMPKDNSELFAKTDIDALTANHTPESVSRYVQTISPQMPQGDPSVLQRRPETPTEFTTFAKGWLEQNPKGAGTDLVAAYEKTKTVPIQSVSVQTFTPANVTAQQEFMKEVKDNYSRLKDAPQQVENIEKAIKLIPGAAPFMGPFSAQKLYAVKLLRSVGIGGGIEGVKDAEELRTRIFSNIMDNLKKMDAQPSQLQQQIMMEALGNLSTDPQALVSVLRAYEDIIISKVGQHNAVIDSADKQIKFPFNPKINVKIPEQGAPDLKKKYGLE